MLDKCLKSLLALAFSLLFTVFTNVAIAQKHPAEEHVKSGEGKLDMKEVIFGHINDSHDFHILDNIDKNGVKHPVSLPLPVILYSPQKGLSVFMSSKFEHGHAEHAGYRLVEDGKTVEPVEAGVTVYDFSLTRNVVQMLVALTLLIVIMLSIAKKYKSGKGVTSAPKGLQGFIEPVITFVRDEVARPNLGYKADKYLPYLLTVFFFILINNIFGLIPGTANVTGNIAFTAVLGIIAFFVILFSSNKHYWAHIFNPPGVPLGVKFILVPVEILSVFIKPFALIIRLFANMVAGHIIIICLISLIFIFGEIKPAIGYGATLVSIPFTIFIYFIEILVAFLQAFIFSMLTAVFIGQAIEGAHDHKEDHAAAH